MEKKAVYICPSYNSFPMLAYSLIAQTNPNWELIIIHDGPAEKHYRDSIKREFCIEDRITFIEYHTHSGNCGCVPRAHVFQNLDHLAPTATHVVTTNPDNYHMPVFNEKMLAAFDDPEVIAAHCAGMIHNGYKYEPFPVALKADHIDCAAFMATREAAIEIGWKKIAGEADDWTYMRSVAEHYGRGRVKIVKGCLVVHN